jgi:hypothetical protein
VDDVWVGNVLRRSNAAQLFHFWKLQLDPRKGLGHYDLFAALEMRVFKCGIDMICGMDLLLMLGSVQSKAYHML